MNGTPSTIKRVNLDLIYSIIEDAGPISKPDIAQKSKLSLVTVNKLVDSLIEKNNIKIFGQNSSFKGRPATTYVINKNLHYFICLYYHKKRCYGSLMNYNGDIVFFKEYSVRTNTFKTSIKDIFKSIDEIILMRERKKIAGIAFAVPGIVSKGVLKSISSISSWEGLNLYKIIEEKYSVPVIIENDVKVATWGLYLKKYKNMCDHLAYIYFEQGIGAGFVCGGNLLTGKSNLAGEIGLIPFYKNNRETSLEKEIISIRNKMKNNKSEKSRCKEKIKSILTEVVKSIIIMTNPEIILIKFDEMDEKYLNDITKSLSIIFSKEHIPVLIKLDDVIESSLCGLWNISYKLFKPSLVIENK